MGLSTISEAIEDIKTGKLIIIVDDEDRENEGDLSMAGYRQAPGRTQYPDDGAE